MGVGHAFNAGRCLIGSTAVNDEKTSCVVPVVGRMDYIQLMLYLTDVDETTHCFSLSPESIDQEILDREPQVERGGICELHG